MGRKLIGARLFSKGIEVLDELLNKDDEDQQQQPSEEDLSSPRDYTGHGTHTLSTAGGAFVPGAGVFGHGNGTASGVSPGARVAVYKACYAVGCSSFDVLAAVLAAVADGVDVISMSLGTDLPSDYLMDPIAIGAFHAVQMGVTVVCSAGNSGPGPGTVSNVAPWMFTVGASTMYREFPAYVTFNGSTIKGQSLADSTWPVGKLYPLITGENANDADKPTANSSLCLPGSLDHDKVKGKIVVCVRGENDRVEKGLWSRRQAASVWSSATTPAPATTSSRTLISSPRLTAPTHSASSSSSTSTPMIRRASSHRRMQNSM